MNDEDYSFLVREVAHIHILCIYICNKCDAILDTIKWLTVNIIEEKLRSMKFLCIPHKRVLKSAFFSIEIYGTQPGFPTKKLVFAV